ncbi:hypothetical protein POTOM_042645 [Populus tomentosa]|uniref:Growth-regulating factor n=1 Tax=Populus tomentosa TaxID=118781 RepID=A0A8X7YGW9_POPTO|nr:hypothetical protein POTOM_042645 [Populus tomentosa]
MMTADDGLNVSNKVAKEINTTTSSSNVDFGVKLHQPIDHHQSFPSSTPMMVPVNHHRPMFDNGPTSSCDRNKSLMSYISDRIYRVAAGGATSGGAVGVRNFQSFDISETSISTAASAFRSPVGNGLNVRFSNGADLEPGRCRRTDGKKWRCSRDVAPDQKYCERHMHRGRPRSRKHVELNASSNNNKKNRHNPAICPEAPATVAISKPTINNSNSGSASHDQFFGSMPMPQPYIQTPVFVNKTSEKTSTFDVNGAYGSTFKEPRSLDWMLKGEAGPIAKNDQQWPHLVHKEIELATEGSFNSASVLKQHYQGESLNLNSFGNFNAREDQQSNQYSLFLDEAPRSFIDAWSNDAISRNTSSVSSDGKLHLSPLSLSMGSNRSTNDETGQIQMGLGLIKSDRNEECGNSSSTPGGPLAEVLQLRTSNTTGTNQSSSMMENGDSISPPATTVSSPSGVLQKTLASFSDSSGNSSPTLASSRTKPEIAMLWLNQG